MTNTYTLLRYIFDEHNNIDASRLFIAQGERCFGHVLGEVIDELTCAFRARIVCANRC